VDRNKIDLKAHRLVVQLNRSASRIELKVFGEDKQLLGEETVRPNEGKVGEPIVIHWTQRADTEAARIELYGYDTEDNWVGVAIIPWNVKIPHEEVHFDSDKATLEKSEVPKLQDSLQRINEAIERYRELGKIQLFIAGHTDTVGSPTYNLDLSRRRAQAIAAWFVKNQVAIPVAFEGFGESVPLVETKDEVDEPKNRRVDYILSVEPPAGKTGRLPAWKYLNRAK
jgi:outer membrane protein OmpA-like peptidoglycan-associated protein